MESYAPSQLLPRFAAMANAGGQALFAWISAGDDRQDGHGPLELRVALGNKLISSSFLPCASFNDVVGLFSHRASLIVVLRDQAAVFTATVEQEEDGSPFDLHLSDGPSSSWRPATPFSIAAAAVVAGGEERVADGESFNLLLLVCGTGLKEEHQNLSLLSFHKGSPRPSLLTLALTGGLHIGGAVSNRRGPLALAACIAHNDAGVPLLYAALASVDVDGVVSSPSASSASIILLLRSSGLVQRDGRPCDSNGPSEPSVVHCEAVDAFCAVGAEGKQEDTTATSILSLALPVVPSVGPLLLALTSSPCPRDTDADGSSPWIRPAAPPGSRTKSKQEGIDSSEVKRESLFPAGPVNIPAALLAEKASERLLGETKKVELNSHAGSASASSVFPRGLDAPNSDDVDQGLLAPAMASKGVLDSLMNIRSCAEAERPAPSLPSGVGSPVVDVAEATGSEGSRTIPAFLRIASPDFSPSSASALPLSSSLVHPKPSSVELTLVGHAIGEVKSKRKGPVFRRKLDGAFTSKSCKGAAMVVGAPTCEPGLHIGVFASSSPSVKRDLGPFAQCFAVSAFRSSPEGLVGVCEVIPLERDSSSTVAPSSSPSAVAAAGITSDGGFSVLCAENSTISSIGDEKMSKDDGFKSPFSPALVAAHKAAKRGVDDASMGLLLKRWSLRRHHFRRPLSLPSLSPPRLAPPARGAASEARALLRSRALAAAAAAQSTAALAFAALLEGITDGEDLEGTEDCRQSIMASLRNAEQVVAMCSKR